MAPVAIAFGLVLSVLGPCFYFPERKSMTALIPTFFGVALLLLGVLGLRESLRKHAMHLAVLLGLIGFIAPADRAAPSVSAYFSGGEVGHPAAVVEQLVMSGLCLIFTGLCVRSFIAARRARAQKAE